MFQSIAKQAGRRIATPVVVLMTALPAWSSPATAQETIRFSLHLLDAVNGEPVAWATVIARMDSVQVRAVSDRAGEVVLKLPVTGRWHFTVQRYGYEPFLRSRYVAAPDHWRIRLRPSFFTTPDIVVLANSVRRQEEIRTSPQAVTLLTEREIRRMPVRDVGDVLTFVPGMMVKNYGGLGGLKTLSLRGGLASQTPILINGVRFDNFQTGTSDLSLLSLAHFAEIRVLRGGNAAVYGADALTGAVHLTTLTPDSRTSLAWKTDIGAFGFQETRVRWQTVPGRWRVLASVLQVNSRGDYPFVRREFGELVDRRRQNADFRQWQGLFSAARPWSRGSFELVVFGQKSRRGVPGPVLQGRPFNAGARQQDTDGLLLATLRQQLSRHIVLQAWTKLRRSDLRYRDPELKIRPEGIDNRYRNVDGLAGIEGRWLTSAGLWRLRLESGRAVLSGDQLAVPDESGYRRVARVQRDFQTGVLLWEGAGSLPRKTSIWRWQSGVRFSRYSDVGKAWSPFLGLNFRPGQPPVHLRMNISRNYRVPTFSEQYYLNYGNRRIQPEDGVSVELGANAAISWFGQAFVDVSLFAIRLRNQIVAVPRSPVFWSTENIGRTRNEGVELSTEWRTLNGHLWLTLAYTFQNPRDDTPGSRTQGKRLIYLPQELVNGLIALQGLSVSGIVASASISARRVSYRYHLPENDFESLLPGYTVVDARISFSFRTGRAHWEAQLTVENVTGTRYEIIKNYPMPLRFWRAGLQVKWDHRQE